MYTCKDDRVTWKPIVRLIHSHQEDEMIQELVKEHGTKKWTVIADILRERVPSSNRSGKQCRER